MPFFNIAVLNNLLTLMVYALFRGCVPVIALNQDDDTQFSWDWHFEQPWRIFGITDISEFKSFECDKKKTLVHNSPRIDMAFDMEGKDFKTWQYLTRRLLKFNEETEAYIRREAEQLQKPPHTLGVLVRGTDYLKLRPPYHPVQPEVSEVIETAKKLFSENHYRHIYLATEEERIRDLFVAAFGKETILCNGQTYYDKIYYGQNLLGITNVEFDRERDNYYKGIEYLSSMVLLSECDALVAGNCGGTFFAAEWSRTFGQCVIFNKGLYPARSDSPVS